MKKNQLIRGLNLSATTSLVVGTIIGTGVFLKSAKMAQAVGTPALVLLAWVAAGLLSLAGALSYAELGAMLPEAGGEYVYLRAAYGDLPAFLFGWMRLVVGSTGSLASMAAGFAIFLAALFPLGTVWAHKSFVFLGGRIDWTFGSQQVVAVGILLFLSAVNCLRVVFGGRVQLFFTSAKVLAIVTIMVGAYFFAPSAAWEHLRAPAGLPAWSGLPAFGAAMLAALWAYDGWNNMPMAAGEVKDPGRNIPRALILGMFVVLTVYLLVNLAYCYALPISEIASSSSTLHGSALPVAAKAAQTFLPRFGVALMAIAGVLSTVGALNGSILTAARIPYAMARDGLFFARFAELNARTAVPVPAVIFQGLWAAVLALSATFDQLTDCVVFAGMIFYAATTAAVFVLRRKMPGAPRPYKTLGYPLVPLVFILVALWLLVNTLQTSTVESVAGLVLIALGLPVFFWQKKSRRTAAPLLVFFLALTCARADGDGLEYQEGGIVRGPRAEKKIALEFSADEFTEEGTVILDQLAAHQARGSFFLTGRCARNPANQSLIRRMVAEGHYVGPHSDTHPLLCPWIGPKKTLVTKKFFQGELNRNLDEMQKFGIKRKSMHFFLPPYEWYNKEIAHWADEMDLRLVNFTPGTRAAAGYTENGASNFVSSDAILSSIVHREKEKGLNGYLLLLHVGSGAGRTDKMANRLGELLDYLQGRGYRLVRVDDLLAEKPTARTACAFDTNRMEFSGTPLQQARCLLRPVLRGGVLGRPLAVLPAPLEQLIGQPVTVTQGALRRYLQAHAISEDDIGGPITNVLRAKYFIIHDTSTPNYGEKPFPPGINQEGWRLNNLEVWKKHPVAHIFVSRTGQSLTAHEFIVPWRATKFESKTLTREQSRGLFVHIENTMPRRSDPDGRPGNDLLAPEPGFTKPMLDRLALLYLTASLEHGRWMVPAYHATVDAGIPDGHDDPQNFDLTLWASRLGLLLKEISPG